MFKGQAAVVEGSAISPGPIKADVVPDLFGNGGRVLAQKSGNGFKAFAFIKFGFNGETRVEYQMFLFVHKVFLPAGRKQPYLYRRV